MPQWVLVGHDHFCSLAFIFNLRLNSYLISCQQHRQWVEWHHRNSLSTQTMFFTLWPFADTLPLVVYTLIWQIWHGFPASAPGRSENGKLSRTTGQPLDGLAGGVPSQPGCYAGGGDRDSTGTRGPGWYRAPGDGESCHFQLSAAPTKTAAGLIPRIVLYYSPLM